MKNSFKRLFIFIIFIGASLSAPSSKAKPLSELMSPEADFQADAELIQTVISEKGFELVKKLGAGCIGEIFVARAKGSPKQQFALKIVKDIRLFSKDKDFPVCENYSTQKKLASKSDSIFAPSKIFAINVSFPEDVPREQTYGYCIMTMPIAAQDFSKSLFSKAFKGHSTARNNFTLLSFLKSIARAVFELNNSGYLHRDLKAANVLLEANKKSFSNRSLPKFLAKLNDFDYLASFEEMAKIKKAKWCFKSISKEKTTLLQTLDEIFKVNSKYVSITPSSMDFLKTRVEEHFQKLEEKFCEMFPLQKPKLV